MRVGPVGGRLPVRARRVPGRDDLVLFEIGAAPEGPHWVVSTADAEALGWALIDAARGLALVDGLTVTDCHISPGGNGA